MIRFIENIGDYYSQHFFTDDFTKKVFDKAGYVTQKKDADGNKVANHLSEIIARISPLREKYYRFKNDLFSLQRIKDKVKRTHDFHKEVLEALEYVNGTTEYNQPVFLNDTEVIPVRYNYYKGGKPYLFIMEMKAIVREGDKEPEGIYEQIWVKEDWEKVFPSSWGDVTLKPDVIKDALSELFIMPEDERPVYVILLAGAKIFLIHYEKWKYDSFLLFDLEELFIESQVSTNRDYLALFFALLAKSNFLGSTDSLLQSLDEDAHKAAYGVTQNLKKGVIYAVESLANEAIWYKKAKAKTPEEKVAVEKLMREEKFAKDLKDECLTTVYRLLFLFYAEAREDLEILPVKDSVYQRGYSLEMLRDLEMVPLTTDSSRNGEFFSHSLWKLFDYLHNGIKTQNGFEMRPLDSPLFDNKELKYLPGVQFRNFVLQQIIKRLSLSNQSKGMRRGRISYANLGINQLGSVYESLLAFTGFFASETLIEVKAADDPDGKEGTFLVPLARRDDFKEEEILKDYENPQYDNQIPKDHFVYRLNGRDRKKSASYYTPEVLTQTTVKYTLKGIIDQLKVRQEKGENCADEILLLKILEPAMGAAAFQNEVINQLADAYLELKETEEVRKGRKRIVPGSYNDEMQKVKAFIAANNVYGVDINPTAVELGKLSLWLNCMHRNMETPFFAHRLGIGNAVVGCWFKVFEEKDVNVEFPKTGTHKQRTTSITKEWWTKAPARVTWDKKGNLIRRQNQFYHFLLPDANMLSSAGISLIKDELSDAQKKAITNWKKEFKQPLTSEECNKLQKLCKVIDTLLDEHYKQIKGIIKDTTSVYAVYGQADPQLTIKGYNEKERLAESRNARSAPFYKLRLVMDYWCSLWFWDARNILDLPSRTEWYNEIQNILGVDLSNLDENATTKEILDNIKKQSADTSKLFENENRLQLVQMLHEKYRFFHIELEFLEVFKEKDGFDIIVGNPPWVIVSFDESEILSEFHPQISIRNYSSARTTSLLEELLVNGEIKSQVLAESVSQFSLSNFIGSNTNYLYLKGQKADLYRCILSYSLELINKMGFAGLLHPESIYADVKARLLRKKLYLHLNYHFQFRNEFTLFKETNDHGRLVFSINIYGGQKQTPSFFSINNLFLPTTINHCFEHDGKGICYGIKALNSVTNKFEWNINGHSDRIVHISKDELSIISTTFENSNNWESTKLISIHSKQVLSVISKIGSIRHRFGNYKFQSSQGYNEVNAVDDGLIEDHNEKTFTPNEKNGELVLSGPNIYVNSPIYKSPRKKYNSNNDYDVVDLVIIADNYLPNSRFKPTENKYQLAERFNSSENTRPWFESFKLAFREMISSTSERSLMPAIIPPETTHLGTIISILFQDDTKMIDACSICSSLPMDFFVKATGKGHVKYDTLKDFPLFDLGIFKNALRVRVLLLNCVNNLYKSLWESSWTDVYKTESWSKKDDRLSSYYRLCSMWKRNSPLRNSFERRMAQIEIDVLAAMAFGLELDELILIYNIQFPVLQENEDATWYDRNGNIIFTNSSALFGVGLDKSDWENITFQVTTMKRKLKHEDTYVHTITKSELYDGKQVTYYSPFDKCDRVEDYKVAWAHFEKVFSLDIKEKVSESKVNN